MILVRLVYFVRRRGIIIAIFFRKFIFVSSFLSSHFLLNFIKSFLIFLLQGLCFNQRTQLFLIMVKINIKNHHWYCFLHHRIYKNCSIKLITNRKPYHRVNTIMQTVFIAIHLTTNFRNNNFWQLHRLYRKVNAKECQKEICTCFNLFLFWALFLIILVVRLIVSLRRLDPICQPVFIISQSLLLHHHFSLFLILIRPLLRRAIHPCLIV